MIYFLIILLLVFLYLVFDYNGPKGISLKSATAFGMVGNKAKDLIVQEFDDHGNLWATRGMIIYKLHKGDSKFVRIARVPSGISILWLNNFTIFRKLTHKPECIEITVSGNGNICAFSAGYLLYGQSNSKEFEKTLKLPHFGIGRGRGILSNGLLKANDRLVFVGEYFRNDIRTQVHVYGSNDFGRTWEVAFEFQSGKIRHIHALQQDPYTGRLWICTGDDDKESMIGYSDDYFETIDFIGQGSQLWRSCQLAFTKEAVYWGTDTASDDAAGIYRWDKKSMQITRLQQVSGAFLFGTRLKNGTIVLSTDREGFPNENDDITRLYVIAHDDQVAVIECGTWNYKKHGFRFAFAKSRLQRNQGNDSLAVNFLNQKEIPDGDLLIISEEELNKAVLLNH